MAIDNLVQALESAEEKTGKISKRKWSLNSFYITLSTIIALSFGQKALAQHPTGNTGAKPVSSMWGPSRPMTYEGILSGMLKSWKTDTTSTSIVLWGGNHRNKMGVLSYNKRKEGGNESEELNLGIRSFPVGDLLEFKGAFRIQENNFEGPSQRDHGLYVTLRDKDLLNRYVKVRAGHEVSDRTSEENQSSSFLNLRMNLISSLADIIDIDLMGVASRVTEDGNSRTHSGLGVLTNFPGNFYASYGWTNNTNEEQGDMTTISVGRYAAFYGEKFPTFFLTYRGNNQKALYIGGLMIGGRQQFVKPAAYGITEGLFNSSVALPDLKNLRRFNEFAVFSNDYEIADLVAFYTNFTMDLFAGLKVGVEELDVYWTLPVNILEGIHLDLAFVKETYPNMRTMQNVTDYHNRVGVGVLLTKNSELLFSYDVEREEMTATLHLRL